MIGCPYRCQLDSWDADMPARCFSQSALDKAESASAPLFNHLFQLSRNLWYTYCQEAHPKQLDNKLTNTNIQQIIQFSQLSRSASTQASYKVYFQDSTGVPLDSPPPSLSDHFRSPISPTNLINDAESGPLAIVRQCEDWNNIK